jgi:hypothetical protein
MVSGVFIAGRGSEKGIPSMEIYLLRLPHPMDPIELYTMSKIPYQFIATGTLPKKRLSVDGLQGVKYYYTYIPPGADQGSNASRNYSVYFSEVKKGWILSCSCRAHDFIQHRPVFDKVIASFKRREDKGERPSG